MCVPVCSDPLCPTGLRAGYFTQKKDLAWGTGCSLNCWGGERGSRLDPQGSSWEPQSYPPGGASASHVRKPGWGDQEPHWTYQGQGHTADVETHASEIVTAVARLPRDLRRASDGPWKAGLAAGSITATLPPSPPAAEDRCDLASQQAWP